MPRTPVPPIPRCSLRLRIDTIGIRPTGAQADTARIVRVALAAARAAGMEPRLEAQSTDANYPLSRGIPSITVEGGGRSEGTHSLAEWYDDGADGWRGPQWAALILLTLAGVN